MQQTGLKAKSNDFPQKEIDEIVNRVNNRPLKCRGFKTLAEVLLESHETVLKANVEIVP